MYWYAMPLLVPLGASTVTRTEPGDPGGETAVIVLSLTTVKLVALVLPNFTAVAPVNPVPVSVTVVPPELGPDVGEMS